MADPRDRPSEQEVRDVVRRIVDRVAVPAPGSLPAPAAEADRTPAVDGDSPASPGRLTIAVGADHGGFALKEHIRQALADQGHAVRDCGTHDTAAVDYPDFALAVARLVADGTCGAGIVVDGAGIGSCMAANKVPGIRAAMCYDLSTARNSREHNHANVLTLGARLIGPGLALDIVNEWLATPWGPGRHAARVAKITAIERHDLETGPVDGPR
jgi:ribose 5-phosphate isomerase B